MSRTTLDVGAAEVAGAMGVSKPSVTRMLGVLMKKGLLVREKYGKIYLTGQGVVLARQYEARVANFEARIPAMGLNLTARQLRETAHLLAAALPETEPDDTNA